VSNQPGSNPAALEAEPDVHVPEVAARPTSRAYKRPVALSDEQPSVGGYVLKATLLDLPEQLRDLELRVGRRSVAGNGCLTGRGHLVEVTRTRRTDSHLHDSSRLAVHVPDVPIGDARERENHGGATRRIRTDLPICARCLRTERHIECHHPGAVRRARSAHLELACPSRASINAAAREL
jgi:hypothetical protein